MNSNDFTLLLHELLCGALFWTVFCRCVRTDYRVRGDVRLAFVALGIVACIGMAAPLAWGVLPSAFTLLLLAAILAVQIVTSRYWCESVPDKFYKPGHAPKLRRSCEKSGGCHAIRH